MGSNSTSPFNGQIDDLKFYNQILTPQQVYDEYSSSAARLYGQPTWIEGVSLNSNQSPMGKASSTQWIQRLFNPHPTLIIP
jgi:hypothetical protein